jgi:DNA polymerase III subunit epsilon
LNEPANWIPAEITPLTGITNEMVAGKRIDAAVVSIFVTDANIIIAHNANFDRKFAERYWPEFEHAKRYSHPRSPKAERSTPGGAYHPAEP